MKHVFPFAFAACFSSSILAATGESCLPALIKNYSHVSDTSASSYALISLVNSALSSSDQASFGGQLDIPNYGSLGLNSNQAQNMAKSFFSSTNLAWDQERMLNSISETLSEPAVEAYRACLAGNQKDGVFAKAYDANDKGAQIEIRWVAGVRAPTQATATFEVEGMQTTDTKKGIPNKVFHTGDSYTFTVDRASGQDIRININIAGVTAHLFIPYIPTVAVTTIYHRGITYPTPEISLRNDGPIGSANVFRSGCAYPSAGFYLIANSAKAIRNDDGPNDGSYGNVIQKDDSVCYSMLFRPNDAHTLSRWHFQIQYDEVGFVYNIVSPNSHPLAPADLNSKIEIPAH